MTETRMLLVANRLSRTLVRLRCVCWGGWVCVLAVSYLAGCKPSPSRNEAALEVTQPPITAQAQTDQASKLSPSELSDSAMAFCADCHVMPMATSFAKSDWPREVQRGFDFYFASGRADLAVPRAAEIVDYFVALAPDEMRLPAPEPLDAQASERFLAAPAPSSPQVTEEQGATVQAVAGAGLQFLDWGAATGARLMLADMRGGGIYSSQFAANEFSSWELLAQLDNPCRLHQCDLDDNGQLGLLVADLGSFLPADHNRGRVVWLRRDTPDSLEFTSEVLLAGCGRVADAQAADLDGDGDTDIVVADFGWHETGRLLWLERISDGPATANSFQTHVLEQRAGAVEVSLVDINADGLTDIVALFGQEIESVVVYLNQGKGIFGQRTALFVAPDPAYGSSGIEVVDLDQDGDLDIVYTNGDSFDSFEVKSYHAVHWLENTGQLEFVSHELARLPGVHRAQTLDWDRDGDLDIIACTFLPRALNSRFPANSQPVALAVLENDGSHNFRLRPMQVDRSIHPALCVADFDGDGKLDVAAANFYEDPRASNEQWVDVLLAK